jgi:tetratricopeptide (TPR) repeat protein
MKKITSLLLLVFLAMGLVACGGTGDSGQGTNNNNTTTGSTPTTGTASQGNEDARAKYNAGVEKYGNGDIEGAFADFNEAIRIDPNMAEAYMNRGSIYAASQEYDKAIEDSTKALDLNLSRAEDQATALTNRAVAYVGQEKYEEAITDATKALEANAQSAKAYFIRGVSYANSQDREKALEDLRRAVELSPDSQEGQAAQQAIDQIEAAP